MYCEAYHIAHPDTSDYLPDMQTSLVKTNSAHATDSDRLSDLVAERPLPPNSNELFGTRPWARQRRYKRDRDFGVTVNMKYGETTRAIAEETYDFTHEGFRDFPDPATEGMRMLADFWKSVALSPRRSTSRALLTQVPSRPSAPSTIPVAPDARRLTPAYG